MMKLISFIYVNILGLFDINKILVARDSGVVSNTEKKTILTVIVAVLYGYIVYMFFDRVKIYNVFEILNIGFLFTSFFCFFVNVKNVDIALFHNKDNDYLFSLPLSKNQIVVGKMFTVYLKNLLYVIVFMLSFFLSYYNNGGIITDTLVLVYFITALFIPLIPIVLATLFSFTDSYFKVKIDNKIFFWVIKSLLMLAVGFLLYLLFNKGGISSIKYLYPIVFIYDLIITSNSMVALFAYVVIFILVIYLYVKMFSYNYNDICSLLNGVEKKSSFVYKRKIKLGKCFGFIRKEFITLFRNRDYLYGSFGYAFMLSIIFCGLVLFLDVNKLQELNNFEHYFLLFVSNIIAMISTLGIYGVCSLSIEQDNLQMLRTFPIGIFKVIFNKWLTNIMIGLLLIGVNTSVILFKFEVEMFFKVIMFVIPILSLMFISFISIVLDLRFLEKDNSLISNILQGRLVNLVPVCLSLLIGIVPVFFVNLLNVKIVLLTYCLILVLGIIIGFIYLIIFRKKLTNNLFN